MVPRRDDGLLELFVVHGRFVLDLGVPDGLVVDRLEDPALQGGQADPPLDVVDNCGVFSLHHEAAVGGVASGEHGPHLGDLVHRLGAAVAPVAYLDADLAVVVHLHPEEGLLCGASVNPPQQDRPQQADPAVAQPVEDEDSLAVPEPLLDRLAQRDDLFDVVAGAAVPYGEALELEFFRKVVLVGLGLLQALDGQALPRDGLVQVQHGLLVARVVAGVTR
mmetsp:Transcript_28378/g.53688  ORF Transcript_28378/g.53688 Transcript_28378/m.53688 type:complete len:220 (-) Transcript_28378:479-1138(-)